MPFFHPTALERIRNAKALAYDKDENSRNTEDGWYALWNHVLIRLVGKRDNLLVSPQRMFWFQLGFDKSHQMLPLCTIKEEELPPPNNSPIVNVPKTVVISVRPARRRKPTVTRFTPYVLRSRSDQTRRNKLTRTLSNISDVTQPEANARERVPDFAVIRTKHKADTGHPELKIEIDDVPIIVEVKAFVSRDLAGAERMDAVEQVISHAEQQALEQVATVFRRFSKIRKVCSIIACGPYWSHRFITREEVPRYIWDTLDGPSDSAYAPSQSTDITIEWPHASEIEDAISINRLRLLRNYIRNRQDMQ